MTSISERLAKCFVSANAIELMAAFENADGANDLSYFTSGMDYQNDRTKPLVSALCSAVEALEFTGCLAPILCGLPMGYEGVTHAVCPRCKTIANLNAALAKMEGEK